jgi:hypothetical protein
MQASNRSVPQPVHANVCSPALHGGFKPGCFTIDTVKVAQTLHCLARFGLAIGLAADGHDGDIDMHTTSIWPCCKCC